MAIVRKSSSGKAIQFILGDEDCSPGTVFQLSASLFGMVMSEQINGPYVVLSRLPIPVPAKKFPSSKVWGDKGVGVASDKSSNAFSKDFLMERKEQQKQKSVKNFNMEWYTSTCVVVWCKEKWISLIMIVC